ncbi:hypothetical protein [Streptacidiphilus sp. EB129]|uniref:hypothetical protein n=1 Tax=Streptacidiphilus sp. EB129 TaxID=3156262 RepID=UPI00351905D6
MSNPTLWFRSEHRGACRAALLAAVGATACVVLTACGSSGGGGGAAAAGSGAVASIPAPGASGATPAPPTTDPDSGRPQIRLDSSQDDINRMYAAHTACLTQKGGPDAVLQWKQNPNTPAGRACLSKLPLDPPELDPAKNPHYSDDLRTMVQCMNSHGIQSEAVPDGSGWALVHGGDLGAPNFGTAVSTCQVQAFGGNK